MLNYFINSNRYQPYIYLVLFCFSFCLNYLLIFLINPEASIYDEFSYLIGADLISQGKLCDPQHPLWKHFETYMVISNPAYCSKYLPLQSFILAIGQIVFNNPIVGVGLIYALTVSISYWTFQRYFSRNWAIFSSLLLAIHPTLINNISLSYMGSVGAFLGSFLIFGSFGRLLLNLHYKNAIIFCLGGLLILFSRPFEGMVIIALISLIIGVICFKKLKFLTFIKVFLIPLFLTLGIFLFCLLILNYLSTGDALISPYLLYEKTYGFMRPFVFSPPPAEISFNHEIMERLHQARNEYFAGNLKNITNFIFFESDKFHKTFVHIAPTISLILFFFIYRNLEESNMRLLVVIVTLFYIIAISMVLPTHAHYANPMIAGCLIFIFSLLKQFFLWCDQLGRRWIIVLFMILFLGQLFYQANLKRSEKSYFVVDTKKSIQKELSNYHGKHLVIVDYSESYHPKEDIIYNFAPIDQQQIIYARNMSEHENEKLKKYFSNRQQWRYDCQQFSCKINKIK